MPKQQMYIAAISTREFTNIPAVMITGGMITSILNTYQNWVSF